MDVDSEIQYSIGCQFSQLGGG